MFSLSIFLTGSMTSLLTLTLIILIINVKVNIKYFILLLGIAPYIPSRPGLIRLDIILNNVSISKFFGYGTSTAVLLNISDKMPESSFLINIGVIGTTSLYLMLFKSEKAKLFLVCFLAMSLTNSIFSAYPINLLELASLLITNKERGINVNN